MQASVDAANAASQHLMSNLIEKDASHQTEGLIKLLQPRPDCQQYIDALREAGHSSPYEGATELRITHAFQDAQHAGCGKPD
jgi:hypothetical protein